MPIGEAIFGAVGNSHGLIAASGTAAPYTARIVGRTDLPSTAPGVNWQPFESGFFDFGCFFLSRTWPDPSATRGGMVFTHTLVAPWAELDHPDGLARLAAMLPPRSDKTYKPSDLELPTGTPLASSPQAGFLLDLLLSDTGPVIWLGETGLCAAIVTLWTVLPSALRQRLAFRLSFGAENAALLPPFVATPRSLAARWSGKPILDPEITPPEASETVAAILDDAKRASYASYAAKFGVETPTFNDFTMLQQVWAIADAEGNSLSSLLMQIRYLTVLSPANEICQASKSALIREAAGAIATAEPTQVAAIRNLSFGTWEGGEVVWNAVRSWSAAFAQMDGDVDAIWQSAVAPAGAKPEWQAAVLGGFDDAVKISAADFWRHWWQRWSNDAALAAPYIDRLPKRKKIETSLIETIPESIPNPLADAVMQAATHKGWSALHATIARRTLPLVEAMARQFDLDKATVGTDGFEALLADATAEQRLEFALHYSDTRLVALASDAAAKSPAIFSRFDMESPEWRAVLGATLARNAEAWRSISDIAAARTQFCTLLREGALDPTFVDAVGATDLADLRSVPARETVWALFAGDGAQPFLEHTASSWLASFAAESVSAIDLEPPLRAVVVDDAVARRYLQSHVAPENALPYIEAFDDISEAIVVEWLQRLRQSDHPLTPVEAERLSSLLKQRQWSKAASALAALLPSGQGSLFAAATMMFAPMLHVLEFQQLMFREALAPTKPEDIWQSFEDVACELFQDGPEDSALWSSAGGDPSDLPYGSTPRARWHKTLKNVRRGRRSMSARALLDAMADIYPNNDKLKWLRRQSELQDD